MEKYHIRFEFDCEGEPPTQHIWKREEPEETHIAEVDEEPISKLGGNSVETQPGVWDWEGPWSWVGDDWEAGPVAKHIIALLNAHERL